jgi:hypothetical protein
MSSCSISITRHSNNNIITETYLVLFISRDTHLVMSSTFLTPALRTAASEVATLLKERNETISIAETVRGRPFMASSSQPLRLTE